MALFGGVEIPGRPDPQNVGRLDLLPLNQIRRMQRCGIAIDREWLWSLSDRLEQRKKDLRSEITSYIPDDKLDLFVGESDDDLTLNVESATQIGELLFQVLGVGRSKKLRRTKNGDRISTGKKQLEILKNDHPVIPKILEYRECSKLKGTYADKLPKIAVFHREGQCHCGRKHLGEHWRVHAQFVTTRTATGRLASRNPNMQNCPARSELGRAVRKAFIPSPGMKLVNRDFAQVELRLLAHFAKERRMIEIFEQDGDIHAATAMAAFNKTLEEVKSKEGKLLYRAPCKNVNFGIAYSLGAPGLYELMAVTYATAGLPLPEWMDVEWCESFIQRWFDLYPDAAIYFDQQKYRARRYGIVWDSFGRVRRVPEVRSCHEKIRAAGLRQGGNMPIQGFAAGVFKLGAARVETRFEEIRAEGIGCEAVLPIHDELLCEVDTDWVEEVGEIMGAEMQKALCDVGTGESYCRVPIKSDGACMMRWEKD